MGNKRNTKRKSIKRRCTAMRQKAQEIKRMNKFIEQMAPELSKRTSGSGSLSTTLHNNEWSESYLVEGGVVSSPGSESTLSISSPELEGNEVDENGSFLTDDYPILTIDHLKEGKIKWSESYLVEGGVVSSPRSESTISLSSPEFEPIEVDENISYLKDDDPTETERQSNGGEIKRSDRRIMNLDNLVSSSGSGRTISLSSPELEPMEVEDNISYLKEDDPIVTEHPLEEDKIKWSGRRIVDIDYFLKQIENEWHGGGLDCSFKDMVRVREIRRGHYSSFQYKCKMCNKVSYFSTEDKRNEREVHVNQAVVNGLISSGNGFSQWSHISAALNIPCMSEKTYLKQEEKLRHMVHDSAWKSMEQAGIEERGLAIQAGEVDEDGIPLVSVIVDGQWGTRSYKGNFTAKSGSAVIIGEKTKKVLFVGVRNKYCVICQRSENRGTDPPTHLCLKNWCKSSSAMEADIIAEGFRLSEDMHKVKYHRLIGDGDSSVMKRLSVLQPYGPKLKVKKIECRNHLLRNLCTKLRAIDKMTLFPPAHRKIVLKNILRIRMGIISAARYRKKQTGSDTEKANLLRQDIENAPCHVFGRHDKCSQYFCDGIKEKNDGEYVDFVNLSNSGILKEVSIAIKYVANHAWSLLQDVDNNPCEQFNSLINKMIGGKRVNYSQRGSYINRVESAVISFNTGEYLRQIHKSLTERSPGIFTKKFQARLNTKKNWTSKRKLEFGTAVKKIRTEKPDKDYGKADDLPDISIEELQELKAKYLETLRLEDSDRKAIEIETRGQSCNHKWYTERRHRLTASNFGTVIGLKKTTNCKNTVYNILYRSWTGRAATHGRRMEPLARERFEETYQKKVSECGLFIDKNIPYLAASPDGVVEGEDAILEVKCPFSVYSMSTIDEASTKIKYVKKKNGVWKLQKNTKYFRQIQGQLHITGRSLCYFVVYAEKWMIVDTVKKDDNYWQTIVGKLKMFYEGALLPEIASPRYGKRELKEDIRDFFLE